MTTCLATQNSEVIQSDDLGGWLMILKELINLMEVVYFETIVTGWHWIGNISLSRGIFHEKTIDTWCSNKYENGGIVDDLELNSYT